MQNFIQSGKVLSLVAPAGGVLSGEFVVVGGLHGFAITDAAEGAIVSVSREGVFSASKASVEIHQGDPLFWDAGNKVFTTVAQDDPIRAIAAEDAASGTATVPVVLVTPIEEGGGGEGYDPDGTTIDLVADHLHVKTGGHTHEGGEVTTAVAEATHAGSADTATSATSAGNADTLDGQHASEFAAAGHTHDDLPSADEKDALAGTNGTPSATNKYVTDSDPRLGGGGPGMLAVFTGSNGAGPCSLPGATVGMNVEFVLNLTDETADGSKFEAVITVVDQIQQTDVGDLSTKHFFLIGG